MPHPSSPGAPVAAPGRRVFDDLAFPGGAWPRSTTPISADGSITDGDDTDWNVT